MHAFADIEKSLRWADQFDQFAYLCPNNFEYPEGAFPHTLAAGCKRKISGTGINDFEKLHEFVQGASSRIFGYLSYELRTQLEALETQAPDQYAAEPLFFFEPEHILNPETELPHDLIYSERKVFRPSSIRIKSEISKEKYLDRVNTLKKHILRGDLYETNFCLHFSGDGEIDPIDVFLELMKESGMPFSGLFKNNDLYILCASPERYLKNTEGTLISQPIKGTLASNLNPEKLFSEKERSENIMIVDLVRNDLSVVCEGGSVNVKELCGIYKLPGLFQMISTIEGTLEKNRHWLDAIKASFPMGSMTGAPKVRAMQLIEACESHQRQLFSGALGYIDPNGNFDFNVIIRSLFYFESSDTLYFSAGSAITALCEAEAEYEECLLKTRALRKILGLPFE